MQLHNLGSTRTRDVKHVPAEKNHTESQWSSKPSQSSGSAAGHRGRRPSRKFQSLESLRNQVQDILQDTKFQILVGVWRASCRTSCWSQSLSLGRRCPLKDCRRTFWRSSRPGRDPGSLFCFSPFVSFPLLSPPPRRIFSAKTKFRREGHRGVVRFAVTFGRGAGLKWWG